MVVDSGRESKKYLSENYMVDYMTLARARGRLPSLLDFHLLRPMHREGGRCSQFEDEPARE